MSKDLAHADMADRFEHLYQVMSGERFLTKQGLGSEVPFFICAYEPSEAVEMARTVQMLGNQLRAQGIRVLEVNLYDLSIELLQARNIFEQILELELTVGKDELKELLQGVLDPEQHLVPAIAAKMNADDFDVMFLTGVGEVFPYIRSHNVLNNLQSTAKEQPTVMFFPGKYTHTLEGGASLDLFSLLHDDKYYRAFNIYHYAP